MKFSLKEFFLKEYEDPTSSKHAQDDSKWAGPNSDKERMPHEEPQDQAQSNSSEAWEETREDGPEKQADDSSLKGFFGGEATPKSSHSSSHKSSEKMSEGGKGSGRKKGSKNKPRDEFGGPPSKPEPQKAVNPDEIPDELPDEWVSDEPEAGGALATAGAKADEPEGEIDWASLDDEEFTDALAGSDKGPEVKTQAAPPKMKDTIKTAPAADQSPYQTFDPNKYDLSPERDAPGDPFSDDNRNVQTWDEFRAAAPKEAAKMETEFAPEELQGAKLSKDHLRRVIMSTTSGKRFLWSKGHNGWDEMDDGNAPTGDF